MSYCTVLTPRHAWGDSFTRSITPPTDDLQVSGTLPNLLPASILPRTQPDQNTGQHTATGQHRAQGTVPHTDQQTEQHTNSRSVRWHATALGDRLAYRSDHPKPGPQGGLVDKQLTAPRTWVIHDLFHGMETVTTIVEKDRLCLDPYFYNPVWSYVGDLYQDYWYFYSRKSLLCLSANIGLAAILANTSLDREFRDWFQDNAATSSTDWEFAKVLGEAWVVPAFLLATWAIDEWAPPYGFFRERLWSPEIGDWSRQSLRALLVGAPVVGVLQYAIGASRPGESPHGSKWQPFNDNNGVSGHAFVGAVPFLVAAKRADHVLLKAAFFAGSGLSGYSRLNDDAHYLSQVLLGWSIAYLSVEATQWTERSHVQYRIVPLTIDGLVGVGVETRY